MFFGGLTIAINGFSMVFLFFYHRFQWFSMVPDHWSNDAMVSMDRRGLMQVPQNLPVLQRKKQKKDKSVEQIEV